MGVLCFSSGYDFIYTELSIFLLTIKSQEPLQLQVFRVFCQEQSPVASTICARTGEGLTCFRGI